MNPVSLLPHQYRFIYETDNHKFSALIGGIGSGKTYAGCYKLIKFLTENPNIPCYYYLPTYPLLRDTAVPSFKRVLDELQIEYRFHGTNNIFSTKYGQIHLKSYHDINSLIGYEHGYCIIDEIDTLPTNEAREVFRAIYERNRTRLPNGNPNRIDFVSTPEGYYFLYDFFKKHAGNDRTYIRARTDDNTYLPSDFAEGMSVGLTENQLKAHRLGEFVNMSSGLVYHAFNRQQNHTNREVRPTDTLRIGMDFNIGKMAAVVGVYENETLHIVHEFYKAYDTEELCQKMNAKYPHHQMIIHPDSSAGNRSTNAMDRTDLDIIERYFQCQVTWNLKVRERINKVNGMFLDHQGNRRLQINTSTCPILVECLESQGYGQDQNPQKHNDTDHLNDALGYAVVNVLRSTEFCSPNVFVV